MSDQDDEKGFLTRWARRKQQARVEPEPAKTPEEQGAAEPATEEEPFDLDLLPKLEDITAETDVSIFLNKAVPESLRNAALKRAWLLDPMIRDYVNPAMEYAYDWNTPGMSPSGPLEASYDALGEMARIMTSSGDHTLVEDAAQHSADEPVAEQPTPKLASVDPDRPAREKVALAERQNTELAGDSAPAAQADAEPRVVSPDRLRRARPRHGGATPS